MSKRGEAMAAADAFLRACNKLDEIEATTATVKRDLAATEAALAETRARLETAQAEAAKEDAEHLKWRRQSQAERARVNTEIDKLQRQLEALQAAVTEKRQEHDNIIAGIAALRQRLKVPANV